MWFFVPPGRRGADRPGWCRETDEPLALATKECQLILALCPVECKRRQAALRSIGEVRAGAKKGAASEETTPSR
ncbi:hypothetical protein GCM10022256_34420 [Frondihabitans peucedani]|uniref:4Fe-4S Wbl-type domain-containing protein n=1 Tax=Frondihabitans peucedani TaxID=598626 RepID=A0ABP8E6H0_9MICO